MLSIIYPIFNRTDLFAATLDSLCQQIDRTGIPFEILVIDDGSTDQLQLMLGRPTLSTLPIRYVRIDVKRLDLPVFQMPSGANNPSAAINVGLRKAKGDWIILTSPEVRWVRPTNLVHFKERTDRARSAPRLTDVFVADVWDDQYHMYISGGANVRPLHFLCAYSRHLLVDVLGGFEEAYMGGWAFEDLDVLKRLYRAGAEFHGVRDILGLHQQHPRPEFSPQPAEYIYAHDRNRTLWSQHEADETRVEANVGRTFGSPDLIVEERG